MLTVAATTNALLYRCHNSRPLVPHTPYDFKSHLSILLQPFRPLHVYRIGAYWCSNAPIPEKGILEIWLVDHKQEWWDTLNRVGMGKHNSVALLLPADMKQRGYPCLPISFDIPQQF